MVPPSSHKVPRVSWYSGSCCHMSVFQVRGFHSLWPAFPIQFLYTLYSFCSPKPLITQVWALSISLAATLKIDVSFSSSGYLDVSVHRVPLLQLFCSLQDDWSLSSRVSPFRYLRIVGYLLLPEAFRSLSRLSSALSAKASALCPFCLISH